MKDRWQKRFDAGAEAARQGKSRDACPYKSDDASVAWLAGYASIRGYR